MAEQTFKIKYYGAVSKMEVTQESVQSAVTTAFQNAKLQKGMPFKALISLNSDMEVQVIDPVIKSIVSASEIKDIICCGTCKLDGKSSKKQDDILAYMVRSGDDRVGVIQCHVFQGKPKEMIQLYNKIDEAMALLAKQALGGGTMRAPSGELVPKPPPRRSLGEAPQAEPTPPKQLGTDWLGVCDVNYLGNRFVGNIKDQSVVIKAARENIKLINAQKKKTKQSTQFGGTLQDIDGGQICLEDPVTLVLTARSLRIVDRTAGETIFKCLLTDVFITISGEVDGVPIFAFSTVFDRLGTCKCFLFADRTHDGAQVIGLINDTKKKYDETYGSAEKLQAHNPFAAKSSARERAEGKLFKNQIHRSHLLAEKLLGAGQFGEVYLAYQSDPRVKPVQKFKRAVKMLKGEADAKAKEEFMHECNVMLELGSHPNVVRMVGVAVQQIPWLCVLEFQPYGDLRGVLMACKQKKLSLTLREQLHCSAQIAAGCAHISSVRFIHMDLAARNVLVGDNMLLQIADFGLTKKMVKDGPYYKMEKRIPMAMKWMAPEALEKLFFSEFSDVWSVGIVMWEILEYGAMPWPYVKNADIWAKLIKGDRLDKPKGANDKLWNLILSCWQLSPEKRPKFKALHESIKGMQAGVSKQNLRDLGALVMGS
eukprot:m.20511 g.20511  ORF g.20511 m.20511 type:complete len:651 (-) comp6865_c0_seq1:143-2095(-)